MGGWFWISSQFTHLGYLSTVPIIIFIFCHLHHLTIIQGPPLLWKGDGRSRGWLPEEDSFLSVPRAFLDTELKRSRQSRPASGRRSSRGRAEPRVVFPCCGGAERAEDIRPPTHTLPLRAQEHSLPTAGLGEPVRELSLHLYPPCRLQDLNQGPPPPWVEGSEGRGDEWRPRVGLNAPFSRGTLVPYSRLTPPPSLFRSVPALPALCFSDRTCLRGRGDTREAEREREGLGSVAHQGDRLGPCRASPQPERSPPRGCRTDALSAVLTPAALSVGRGRRRPRSPAARSPVTPPPRLSRILSPEGTLRDRAPRMNPGRRSERKGT